MRLMGIDPGLRNTGWGIIEATDNRLRFVADGVVKTDNALSLAERLVQLRDGLEAVFETYRPQEAAVEETFVNKNAVSTLKLGHARGIALLVPAARHIPVAEYLPNLVKKTVVGTGHAAKEQVQMMVKRLLPAATLTGADAADALAVAICHAHFRETADRLARQVKGRSR
ncbi:MAG: crossover junction endodeoxyribonuclease RuvC [Magnetovibrionaceae bacterium]